MNSEQFGKTYLRYEANIAKVLHQLKIYDEDLLHDTYIALYNHSQHAEIRDFVNTFVAFYQNLNKRREEHDSHYQACDNATMIERYDRIDEDDWEYRERISAQIDIVIKKIRRKKFPGEHTHKRAIKVLMLYREGLTFREIASKLGIDVAAVHRHLKRTITRIKSQQEMTTL